MENEIIGWAQPGIEPRFLDFRLKCAYCYTTTAQPYDAIPDFGKIFLSMSMVKGLNTLETD